MGKQRVRVTRWGAHTPEQTVNYETLVKQLFIGKYPGTQVEGPLEIEVSAYFPIAKSVSKKKSQQMLAGEIRPTSKPDLDNILKIVTDALNQVAYKDDSQIVSARIEKHYCATPRVEVCIREVQTDG